MFLFKRPPSLRRYSHPIIRVTETLGTATEEIQASDRAPLDSGSNALVLDARSAKTLEDLTWLYRAAKKHANSDAFRKPGGRVVIVRSCPEQMVEPEAVAVSDAIVGFAKSLAKENGTRGATVNLLRDAAPSENKHVDINHVVLKKPLDWLLSHNSCYVTGQEIVVVNAPLERKPTNKSGPILISGAAGGIGRATAQFLCDDSQQPSTSKMLLVDHPSTESKLEKIALDLETPGSLPEVEVLPLDLSQPDSGDLLSQAGARLGGLERIIHAAGITRDKTLRNMDYESSWKPVLDVNLRAAINIDKALLSTPGALMKQGDGSSFVYFCSTSGISGNAGQSNYAASKSGLLGYAEAMAKRHPHHAFRVVSPGFIDTDMTRQMPFLVRLVASRLNALGQAGKPEDVAAAVAFLSSPDAFCLAPGFHLRVCGMFMGGR